MSDISILEAKEGELAAIIELYKELDEYLLSFEEAMNKFNQIKNDPNHTIYVAKKGTEVIGTFALILIKSFAKDGLPSAVLEDVAVSGKYQGQGIGKTMMYFAMEKCKEKGCYKIALSSQLKRENAHKFYESLGFEKMGYSFVIHPALAP